MGHQVRAIILSAPHLKRDIRELRARVPNAEVLLGEQTPKGADGCLEMHKQAIRMARDAGDPAVFVMEDDCAFTDAFDLQRWIADAQWAADRGYDVLVGGSVKSYDTRVVREGLIEVSAAHSAHCLVYLASGYDKAQAAIQPYDVSLGRDCKLRTLLTYPFVAVQRAAFSGIQQKHVNYVPEYARHEHDLQTLHIIDALACKGDVVADAPTLIACYDGALYERLAKVLAYSASRHCSTWHRQIRHVSMVKWEVSKHQYWAEQIDAAADGARLLLMDCDALILHPLDDVWEQPFDMAYTARDKAVSSWPNNAGVLFVRVSPAVRTFVRTLLADVRRMLKAPLADQVRWRNASGSIDQAALMHLFRSPLGQTLTIAALPCRVWNCEDSEWARFDPSTRILHVKGSLRNSLCGQHVSPKRQAAVAPLAELWKAAERAMQDTAQPVTAQAAATWTPVPIASDVGVDLALPSIAITMRTANRTPKQNYVGGTVRRLLAQGVDPASVHVCATSPDVEWLSRELHGAPVTLHLPRRVLSANENGLAQVRAVQDSGADWVLLLEDDLSFCTDFLPSVQHWIARYQQPDRHVYRFFGVRLSPPNSGHAYDVSLVSMCATQAVLLRMTDARDFADWADVNLNAWGAKRGNKKMAFDKLISAWALTRWPKTPGVMSRPLFVKHIGDASSLHSYGVRNDKDFAGESWTYQEASA